MKKLFFLMACAFFLVRPVSAEVIPKPEGWINDYAHVISAEYQKKLEALISELESKTSAEIAVVTVKSIAPHDEVGYARLLFDNWKIGKKGRDNGVLVFLAVDERRWRIETGYGVEGILTDGRCGEIGRNVMVPIFKQGNYGEGLYSGVAAIASLIARDSKVTIDGLADYNPSRESNTIDPFVSFILFYIGAPIFFFAWNLPWPVYIGLPLTIIFAFALFGFNPISGLLVMASYVASMIFRFSYWLRLSPSKRKNFFGPQTYGGTWAGNSGGWGISGGGFGGGGWSGGGGFGGGGGGGGGRGGGF